VLERIDSDEPCQFPKEFSTMETKLLWRPRVVLAEQNEEMLRNISRIVEQLCQVVEEVRDGESAINAVLTLQPDLIIVDIPLPTLDGIQVVRRLRALNDTCPVLMLTGFEDQDYIDAAIVAGANGFVFKRTMGRDLLFAIGEVLTGRTFLSTHPRN
jgi:two-component system response regulator DegU